MDILCLKMILKAQCPMDSNTDMYAKIISNILQDKLSPKSHVTMSLHDCVKNSLDAVRMVAGDINIARQADQYILVSILTNFNIV